MAEGNNPMMKAGGVWPEMMDGMCSAANNTAAASSSSSSSATTTATTTENGSPCTPPVDLSFLNDSRSPMMMVMADAEAEIDVAQPAQPAQPTQPASFVMELHGDALYASVLRVLMLWGQPAFDKYSVFDRNHWDVLADDGLAEMLMTIRRYDVCPDEEMLVYAIALMQRAVRLTGLPITDRNAAHVFLACTLLANKVLNDVPYDVQAFDKIARVRSGIFLQYEALLLQRVFNWSLEVSDAEMYAAQALLQTF